MTAPTAPPPAPAPDVVRGLAVTWSAAWREALVDRRGLATKVVAMVANDGAWLVFWFLFFNRVGPLRGWDLASVALLLAVVDTGAGGALSLFAETRAIGDLATSGRLDAALALPLPTLPYVLLRRVEPLFLGDVAFGLLLFGLFGRPTPGRALVFVLVVACSLVLTTGALVTLGSLGLILGRREPGDLGFHVVTLFASYPVDVFGGPTRLFLHLVVPTAFISSVPAKLIEDPDPLWALALATATVVVAAAAWFTFGAALRRHTGGSTWTEA